MEQLTKITSDRYRIIALALLTCCMMISCSVLGAGSVYLLWEVLGLPQFHSLVQPLEASALAPLVGPRFGNVPSGGGTELAVEGGPRFNILLLGLDQRGEVQHRAFRTDTIMIASLNTETKQGTLFSIPRDLYVEVPEHGKRRINIVHVLGETQGYPGGGPALLMETVEHNFGISIHGYAMVNFQGFRDIVDLLGGVDIDVEKEIWDHRYPNDHGGEMTIHIPAGRQHMDSEMLLHYCRSRYTTDDFDRAGRQQMALMALGQQFLSLQMLPRLPGLLQTMSYTFYTDLEPGEIIGLARIASQVDPADVRFVVIDRSLLDPSQRQPGDEPDLLYPDWAKVQALVDEVFAG
jgi:LCP family protein required for cell wall assembly